MRQEADSLNAAFDLECEQGRFPLRVDHIRGKNGPGCDLLSFEDEATRNRAREEERYWPGEVARFIEVKTTNTTLTINEANAAREHGERYFLYQVRPQGGGHVITVVPNPLGQTPSIAHPSGWDVDVAVASVRRRFR